MDTSKKIIIIILVILAIVFVGVRAGYKRISNWASHWLPVVSSLTYENADQYTIDTAGFTRDTIRDIEVEWISGDVNIEYGNGDSVYWKETYIDCYPTDETKLRYWVHDGRLDLRYCQAGQKSKHVYKNLTLVLPNDWQGNMLKVSTVNGTNTIKADAKCIKLATVNGNNDLYTNQSERIEIAAVNGALTLHLPQAPSFVARCEKVNSTIRNDFHTRRNGDEWTYGDSPTLDITLSVVNGAITITH